jgi:hypothetical protein
VKNISLQFENYQGLLSSCSQQDLYQICKSNGITLDYPSFVNYRGGVLCLDLGKDIGLEEPYWAPGLKGQFNFRADITFQNTSSKAFVQPNLYISTLSEGTCILSPNTCAITLGNLTADVVADAKSSKANEMSHDALKVYEGSGFFSSLKNIVNKVATHPIAKSLVSKHAPELLNVMHGVGQLTGSSIVSGGRLRRR